MTTTCQQIIDRAKSYSGLNTTLGADSAEMMTRIRSIQQRVFTATATLGRARFTVSQAVNTNNAASARTYDLTGLTLPLERILRISLTSSGAEINQVSEIDTDAKLAPRYFVRGTSIIEVGSDYGASGVVNLTVLYVYGATAIAPSDSPSSKNVTVPDEWIDVIVIPLAMYMHQKDPGRDPGEHARLVTEYMQAWEGYLQYLTNYGGDISRRALLPAPPEIHRGDAS